MKFKVGDIVKAKNYSENPGVIICIDIYGDEFGIDFGEGFDGHVLNGKIKTKTGWYIHRTELELYKKSNKGRY